jgi:DNA uptake protein ComE-like DNA-binding protein
MEKSFSIAENAATHDWIPIVKNFHRQEPVFKAYLTAVNEEDWTSISTSGLSWPLFFSSESVDVPTEVKIENPPNSGGDGDGGGALKEVSWKKIFPMVNRNLIPFLPPYFDGRKKELKKIFQNLRASATESNGWMRVCNIMGNQGIGKSSLAIAIASYSNSREWYPNGVHFISIETIMSEYLKSHPLQDEEEDHPQSISQQLEILKQTSSCTFKSEFNRNVLSYFQDMIEETLVSSSTKEQLEPSTLLILDGCDYFIPVTLRDLLLRILQQYPGVQIITTSRQEMKININSKLVEEMTMALHALDKVSAAQLLLNLSPRRLSYAELKKSKSNDTN